VRLAALTVSRSFHRRPPDLLHTISTSVTDRDGRINRRHKEIAMYFRPARTVFGLIAVGGAVAVGVTTHDAGFTALTFIGGLMLPRILGLRGHRAHGWGCGGSRDDAGRDHMRSRLEQRMESWHRQAHGDTAGDQPPAASAAGA